MKIKSFHKDVKKRMSMFKLLYHFGHLPYKRLFVDHNLFHFHKFQLWFDMTVYVLISYPHEILTPKCFLYQYIHFVLFVALCYKVNYPVWKIILQLCLSCVNPVGVNYKKIRLWKKLHTKTICIISFFGTACRSSTFHL